MSHKKDLEQAINSASRNMTLVSALAFIAGLMLANFFLAQEVVSEVIDDAEI
jgi:hypothetical protein